MTCPDCGISMEFAPTPWPFTGSDLQAASIYYCRPCDTYWQKDGVTLLLTAPPVFQQGSAHA